MLAVQEYLKSNTIASLESIGVFAKYHPTLPYVILDYDQIESSKFKEDPIVKECRGLVIRTDDYSIIHKAFNRFYNLNESSCTDVFDWSNFSTTTKEDGSLIKVRSYEGDLLVTTRNSFAESEVGGSGISWKDLVKSCLTQKQRDAIYVHYSYTFVFELCTPHNTVVVNHPEPKLVLLSIFDYYGNELNSSDVDAWNTCWYVNFNRPEVFPFKSLDEVQTYLKDLEDNKNDTEGVVLKDCNGVRLKCKSLWYLKLHRLSGNGNISLLKNMVPIILQGEKEEILSYFPYLEEKIIHVEKLLNCMFCHLTLVWEQAKDIEDQKEFALMITKQFQTKFSSILFNLKKEGKIQDFDMLKHKWHQSEVLILKSLEGVEL